jgi:hypothetical protein
MARHKYTYTGERRTVYINVQMTPSERAALESAAAVAGAGLSHYVRDLCLGRPGEPATVAGACRNPEATRLNVGHGQRAALTRRMGA